MSAADWAPIVAGGLGALATAGGMAVQRAHQSAARRQAAFDEACERVPLAASRREQLAQHEAAGTEPPDALVWGDETREAVFRYVIDGREVTAYGPARPKRPADYLTEADREWLRAHGWRS